MFAVGVQLSNGKSALKYVWIIPVFYLLIAGVEALIAGTVVGLMYVLLLNYEHVASWI